MMHGSTVTKVTHTGRMKRGVGDVGTAAVYVWGGSNPPAPPRGFMIMPTGKGIPPGA